MRPAARRAPAPRRADGGLPGLPQIGVVESGGCGEAQAPVAPECVENRPTCATAPRQETLVWIVLSPDGRPAAKLAKVDFDRHVAAGEFDARMFVKRQDWSEAKSIAEVYQGLAVACADKPAEAAGKEDGVVSSLSHPASPWAAAPELTTVASPPRRPARPPDRLRWAKIFLLVGALLCGFVAFYGGVGDASVQPALPRRLLFLLFAAYWLGAWLLAAALFGWQFESAEGELRGPHRVSVRSRHSLAVRRCRRRRHVGHYLVRSLSCS